MFIIYWTWSGGVKSVMLIRASPTPCSAARAAQGTLAALPPLGAKGPSRAPAFPLALEIFFGWPVGSFPPAADQRCSRPHLVIRFHRRGSQWAGLSANTAFRQRSRRGKLLREPIGCPPGQSSNPLRAPVGPGSPDPCGTQRMKAQQPG